MQKLGFRTLLVGLFMVWLAFSNGVVEALDNGLAKTPPMGWNSWNNFKADIDEEKIKEIADAMVSSGMRDAGYVYLNLDDSWMDKEGRDEDGNLVADPDQFPSGIKALTDYVHSKGLKLGIYGDRGTETCQRITESGSYGYEAQDAATFASWGVDYLKYDNCNSVGDAEEDYTTMSEALLSTGRDIVFSICAWNFQEWMPAIGNLWRTTGDIEDSWSSTGGFSSGLMEIYDTNVELADYAGPGAWNDPDMMEVGNFGSDSDGVGMTMTEYRTHFSLWAIMAAPLISGNDIRNMPDEIKEILLAPEVIAVDQDTDGFQGRRVFDDGDHEILAKELADTSVAVVLLNRGDAQADMTVSWTEIGLQAGNAQVRDLWAHADRGEFNDSYSATVESHGVVMLKITQTPPAAPAQDMYLSDMMTWFARGETKQELLSVEGEDTTYSGAVTTTDCDSCSGGVAASGIGEDPANFVTYTLMMEEAGNYILTIDGYPTPFTPGPPPSSSDESDDEPNDESDDDSEDAGPSMPDNPVLYVSVNGGQEQQLTFSRGFFSSGVSQQTINVELEAGENTLKFYNDSGEAPYLDRFALYITLPSGVLADQSFGGQTITLNGTSYDKGLGVHADSDVRYYLGGNFISFTADIGVDDEVGDNGSVVFQVWGDDRKLYDSGVMTGSSATQTIDVDVQGVQTLKLYARNGRDDNSNDHADWADAKLIGSWSLHTENGGNAAMGVNDGQVTVAVSDTGSDPWSVQTTYEPFDVFENLIYQISFDAFSSVARTIGVLVESALGEEYFFQEFNLFDSMTSYSYEFSVESDALVSLTFLLGDFGDGMILPEHEIVFDNVSIHAVPEPGTSLLIGLGCLGLIAVRWRRKKHSSKK